MTIKSSLCLAIAASAALTPLLSSCDTRPDITGTWTGSPVRINDISAACDASATMSITFSSDNIKSRNGVVSISALIDANQPVEGSIPAIDSSYEVSIAATASVNGVWSFEKDDDDDIVISFDHKTLDVNVDPHGVTFSSNLLTGAQQPMIDSLSTVTAAQWKNSIRRAMENEFFKFQNISDIKVNNGIMSCEINDRDFTFRKVQ